ncbi:hypothetical protein F511_29264 [Dorcoceras hygrometricum]|uniref:Uncharacterized protein n=1 Tax=Dorcoceras hygrometricum TaxID=472368 RepID=A0A2Z7BI19_9LAMI|nr:hypothetical protein F511_29264 [Dorcoceras hygrometricum]
MGINQLKLHSVQPGYLKNLLRPTTTQADQKKGKEKSWLERDREVAVSGRVFVRAAVSSMPVSREIYALYVGCLAGFNQISRACIVVIIAQNQGTDLELEIQLGLAWDLIWIAASRSSTSGSWRTV